MRSILTLSCTLALLLFNGCDSGQKKNPSTESPPASTVVLPVQQGAVPASTVPSPPPAIEPTTPLPTRTLFHQPVEPHIFELPAQALSLWRDFRSQQPTLVLLADEPYLNPLPASLQADALKLIFAGTSSELRRRSDYNQPDPLILGPQSVRAALLAGLFREVVWLLPDDRPLKEFSWAVMETQLRDASLLPAGQKLQLSSQKGIAIMTVDGVPVTLIHPDGLADYKINGPVILHFDLSYFKATYRSEVRIPAYKLLGTMARMLRQSQLKILATTLSYSTRDGNVSLTGRFTLPAMVQLMLKPALLDGPMPRAWKLRSRALYQLNMYMESEVTRLYEELVQADPNDPAALYDLAQRRFFARKFTDGLKLLDRAVARDPGYALAYLDLAEKGEAAKDLKTVRQLLDRAGKALPENPMITMRRVDLLLRLGEKEEAGRLLATLEALPWSPEYHAEIPVILQGMRAALSK